jgi:multiple antibiotic resistance protein
MQLSFKDTLTITFTLFAVIDIIGGLPVIISVKKDKEHFRPLAATLFAGFLMLFFLFVGEAFLGLMGVDVRSFALAGSIVIFILSLEMILGINIFRTDPDAGRAGNYVPLAFPIIAGSGTLTTIISLRAVYDLPEILIGIIINLVVIFLVLRSTDWLEKKLGKATLGALKKFFGVILLAIAIKIFGTYVHIS